MFKKILLVVLLAFMAVGTTHAGKPQVVMIHSHVVFSPVVVGTFTATPPLCASGTFTSTQFISNPSQLHGHGFMAEKLLKCSDGSGTFNIQFHPLAQGFNDPEFLLTGPWSVVNGGTGKYVKLTGHGDFGVVIDFDQDPWIGDETYVGSVQLETADTPLDLAPQQPLGSKAPLLLQDSAVTDAAASGLPEWIANPSTLPPGRVGKNNCTFAFGPVVPQWDFHPDAGCWETDGEDGWTRQQFQSIHIPHYNHCPGPHGGGPGDATAIRVCHPGGQGQTQPWCDGTTGPTGCIQCVANPTCH